MIFDPSSAPHLKPWLVRTLEPICDAEPGALADYILALLKHNVPEGEMRNELVSQLEEFLENECKSFIDTLFTVLRTKSYLPYNPPSPPPTQGAQSTDNGIPIPLDTLMSEASGTSSERTRKRSSSSDERDGRPKKGPRLSNDPGFSRYGNGRQDGGAWGGQQFGGFPAGGMDAYGMQMGQMGMGMGMPMNGMGHIGSRHLQGYQPPGQKRGICRDYHNHGFCARGDMCKYSHGEDAVVPSQIYPMAPGMMPFLYNMFNPGAQYDPNDPQGNSRQNQRAPLLPRIPQEDGNLGPHPTLASGELPVIQDLTPSIPSDATNNQPQSQSLNNQSTAQSNSAAAPMAVDGFNSAMYPGIPNFGGIPQQYPGMPIDMPQMPSGENAPSRPQNNFRGRGGNRGRGTFGADANLARPGRRSDKTLVVEKIPDEKLTLEQVNTWFKKFGTVTNVAVDTAGAKALVSFSTHEEAHAAWKSEDAVFGNRFVKVFWHRPMEGHGQIGQRALAASATLVANMTNKDNTPVPSTSTTSAPQVSASSSSSGPKKISAASALAAKQALLEKQIAEQKSLMGSLSTATPEQKKDLMARLRKLNEEMEVTSSAPTPPFSNKNSTAVDAEQKELERLDKELENHGTGEVEETTEQLKAKLEKLKAEAASLGISEAGAESSYPGYRGVYRGRARGRGFYRGGPTLRGGPPRGSLKLDNRPKRLLVKGAQGDEGLQAVKEWYETGGQVESIETVEDGDILVSFKSRAVAEQALAKGTVLPTIGKVPITWYTGKPGTSTANTSSTPAPSSPAQKSRDVDDPMESAPTHHHHQEEEIVASGWGDDDGDGMGML